METKIFWSYHREDAYQKTLKESKCLKEVVDRSSEYMKKDMSPWHIKKDNNQYPG